MRRRRFRHSSISAPPPPPRLRFSAGETAFSAVSSGLRPIPHSKSGFSETVSRFSEATEAHRYIICTRAREKRSAPPVPARASALTASQVEFSASRAVSSASEAVSITAFQPFQRGFRCRWPAACACKTPSSDVAEEGVATAGPWGVIIVRVRADRSPRRAP